MTTTADAPALAATAPLRVARVRVGQHASSLAYDRWMVALSAWLLVGLFVDGWAHVNLRSLESFFTPWHGLFYSGFFAVAALIDRTHRQWTVRRAFRAHAADATAGRAQPDRSIASPSRSRS